MAGVHEDFGEKIGGAKKDLWKDRGLYADDLEAMNEREAEKFVKKDNVWKKPDYAAMLEEGIPLGVVYFIKKARDGLNASPQYYRTDDTPEKRTARQKEYIKTVRELQTVLSDVRTVEDAVRAYDRFFVDNGYLEKVQGWGSGIHYRATKKGQDNPVITNKLSNTMLIRSAEYFERNFTQEAKKEQFCVSKEQKIPKGYAIHFNDGKQTYSKNGDWKPGTYYVTKGYSILRTNFGTKEAALKWVQELAKGRNKNGKIRFVPPQLAHVKRTGPDYRNGVEITGQHYLDTFGFRGGEFGNWMNQNDRQTSLNMGFEALKDLASALKISDKDIAYQGTLAIAFGARGSGNAAAHYERMVNIVSSRFRHGPKTEERAIDEAMQKVISEKYLMLPLYLYDHSGLAMSTESFSGRAPHAEWDSGQVGWIYVSKEDALKEFDADKMTGAIRQKADALMRSEVAAYDSYLRGECYGFELYKNGELSDSCWGFMGNFSNVLKDMAEYLPDECKGMVDHLEEQERPATIIKTLLKHAKIQVDQAAKAFEHASRQQVLGESR